MIKCDICNNEKCRMSIENWFLDVIVCNIDNPEGENILDSLGDICPHCKKELEKKLKSYSSFTETKTNGYCDVNTEDIYGYLSVEDTEDLINYLVKLQSGSDDEDYLEWKYESIAESMDN